MLPCLCFDGVTQHANVLLFPTFLVRTQAWICSSVHFFPSFCQEVESVYSCVCFRAVVCNKANALKWQMHPGGGGWMEMRLRPHQLATAQALTSASRHYRMSTGQGQSSSGAAACSIPLTAVIFVSPPRRHTRKCNHVVGSTGERS